MAIAFAIYAVSFLLWGAFVFSVASLVNKYHRYASISRASVLVPIILFVVSIAATLAAMGLVFIRPYEVGVVVSVGQAGGIRPEPLTPGLNWIFPLTESVVRYSTARQTFSMARTSADGGDGEATVEARTLDGQRIFVDSSVIYEIDPSQVVRLYVLWQHRYEKDLIYPEARGIIRDVVSQYRVDEVVSTKRFEVTAEISRRLDEVLSENGLRLVDFVLRDITFTPEYAQAIEQKQIAEQQALQAKFVVEQKKHEAEQARQIAQGQADAAIIQARGEAEARLIKARAEAEALKLVAEALKSNPDLLTYEYISKLSPGVRVIMVPSNTPFILPDITRD